MKKVVLFKSVSEDYAKVFGERNYEAIFVEPLQFESVNAQQLAERLRRDRYTGLVLTSPRAIQAVAACWAPAEFVIWNTKRTYTVGEASARKTKLLLGLEALGATAGNAEKLAALIAKENPPASEFLFPCGNLTSETLPAALSSAGIAVDAVAVYETKENENLRTSLMELNDSTKPCCMVFFSPSGCEYVYRQLQTFNNELGGVPHFAIGNSTAHKIVNLGVEMAGVAAEPRPESVLETVEQYFRTVGAGS